MDSIPQIHTNLLWDLALLFGVISLAYFTSIFVLRMINRRKVAEMTYFRKEWAEAISHIVFHSNEDPVEEQKAYLRLKVKIRADLARPYFRKLLSEMLLDLHKDLEGHSADTVRQLFRDLQLHHDCYDKLKSMRWPRISQGIHELTQMQVLEAYFPITRFLNDRRSIIRKQSELAIVELQTEGINYFLNTTRSAISQWQQLKMIELLEQKTDYQPPAFKQWLLSSHTDTVLFALRLILHFQQNDGKKSIIELSKHIDFRVRHEALRCIRDFGFEDALPLLEKLFKGCDLDLKLDILDTFGQLGSTEDIEFLENCAAQSKDFLIASKALAAINQIEPDRVLPSVNLESVKLSYANEMPQWADDRQSFEVAEVSFYEEVEFPVKTRKPLKSKEAKPEEPLEPNFELNLLDGDLEDQVEEQLGVVHTVKPLEESSAQEEDYKLFYQRLDLEERRNFIRNFSYLGNPRELELLEYIVEFETDDETQFQAFQLLKSIQADTRAATARVVEEVHESEHSIFYQLIEFTPDNDLKKNLIQEAGAIGDRKEIAFLKPFLTNEDKLISKLASRAVERIEARLLEVSEEDEYAWRLQILAKYSQEAQAISAPEEDFEVSGFDFQFDLNDFALNNEASPKNGV
ncbi:HEAT repeat domain-containing protein [Aureicoccus marinus]|nr:HEAT repeat domain-containing protein [Aureicoccus marinus]